MVTDLHYDFDELEKLCKQYHVIKLEVFGSRARGEAKPDSDVDLLVTFEPEVDLGLSYFGLGMDLESLLGHAVDIVERHVVEQDRNPYFRREVLAQTRLLYAA